MPWQAVARRSSPPPPPPCAAPPACACTAAPPARWGCWRWSPCGAARGAGGRGGRGKGDQGGGRNADCWYVSGGTGTLNYQPVIMRLPFRTIGRLPSCRSVVDPCSRDAVLDPRPVPCPRSARRYAHVQCWAALHPGLLSAATAAALAGAAQDELGDMPVGGGGRNWGSVVVRSTHCADRLLGKRQTAGWLPGICGTGPQGMLGPLPLTTPNDMSTRCLPSHNRAGLSTRCALPVGRPGRRP